MARPILTPEQIAHVSRLVAQYIAAQRQTFRRRCVSLTEPQRVAMNGFFAPRLLDNIGLVMLDAVRVENPPFYPMLVDVGFTNLPDFSLMAAITFCDVVVSHEPFRDGLLFHELVHVEQYRQLGITRFSELYVRGFLSGGGYDSIPLEVNAHTLDYQFQRNPQQRFSVADEVARWVRENRF